ncbi:MAG TPA: glycoside hydrolase family 127 protein, partial [Acidobacteriota bacterium]|nr:glycoside hydrolase family 127 protein [Acidobacteriota bacterium]
HRGKGEMSVWLARDETAVTPLGWPTLASTSKVETSFGETPEAVNDLLQPASSDDHEVPFFHWWPHKGTREGLQYDFPERAEVSIVEVYWFDDTGVGECRLPKTWRVLYKDGDDWKPVHTRDTYATEKDRFNKVVFETVATTALRVEIESQTGFAGGVHEWTVK